MISILITAILASVATLFASYKFKIIREKADQVFDVFFTRQ